MRVYACFSALGLGLVACQGADSEVVPPIPVCGNGEVEEGEGCDSADKNARIRFTSAVLPADLRRTRNVEELLPWLYLKGISTGQFEETLAVLLGPDAPGLSATTIRRLVAAWQDKHERWQGRDLSAKRYVYVWADGVYFAPRPDGRRVQRKQSSSTTDSVSWS